APPQPALDLPQRGYERRILDRVAYIDSFEPCLASGNAVWSPSTGAWKVTWRRKPRRVAIHQRFRPQPDRRTQLVETHIHGVQPADAHALKAVAGQLCSHDSTEHLERVTVCVAGALGLLGLARQQLAEGFFERWVATFDFQHKVLVVLHHVQTVSTGEPVEQGEVAAAQRLCEHVRVDPVHAQGVAHPPLTSLT